MWLSNTLKYIKYVYDSVRGVEHVNEAPPETNISVKDSAVTEPFIWEYSRQYSANVKEGLQKPPPAFGSPTFVMHLGIWQKLQSDEIRPPFGKESVEKRFGYFDDHNEKFIEEINKFITRLQIKGRVLRKLPGASDEESRNSNIENFLYRPGEATFGSEYRQRLSGKASHKFKTSTPQSVAFTIWWLDSNSEDKPVPNERVEHPPLSAIRVRVQVQSHLDHVTLSFFIDVGKPYGHTQIYSSQDITKDIGRRRKRISAYLKTVREVSAQQIKEGLIEQDRLPEKGIEPKVASELLNAAEYFYKGIWEEFAESFGIRDFAVVAGSVDTELDISINSFKEGERFADFRGLIVSMPGLDMPLDADRRQRTKKLRERLGVKEPENLREWNSNVGIGNLNTFDFENNEPNTILKSLWPFLRRMTPWADYKDFIGCGLIGRRLIYATPLGATGSFFADEEGPGRNSDVPALSLPSEEKEEGLEKGVRPIRYLALTRGEPPREQIGRFVEIINAVGTKRLFALKNFGTVKNAAVHIRLLGRELDGVLQRWGNDRKRIEDWYNWELRKVERPDIANKIEAQPEAAILWYLTEVRSQTLRTPKGRVVKTDADMNEIRSHYRTLYDRGSSESADFLEQNPEYTWIQDVTIYHIFSEYAQFKMDPKHARNNSLLSQEHAKMEVEHIVEKITDSDKLVDWLAELFTRKQKQEIPTKKKQQLDDLRAEKTSQLVKTIEQRLVEIGAALDNIGNGGAGRILYVINRAKYHIFEFERMVKTLGVTNIDGWINYDQFVQRALMPTFNSVRITAERLISLRERLQSVTEMIQTSALIVEAEATRTNTATLRRIASNVYFVALPVSVIAVWLAADVVENLVTKKNFLEDYRWLIKPVALGLVGFFFLIRNSFRPNRSSGGAQER